MSERVGRGSGREGHRPVAERRVSRPRITRRRLIVSGILVASFSVLATLGLLRVYPPPDLRVEPVQVNPPAPAPLGIDALILAPDGNRAFFTSQGGDHDRHVARWKDALERLGAGVGVASTLDQWDDQVLVLPHVYCLSEENLRRIGEGIEHGKGILVAGIAVVRGADGTWIGWNRMHSFLGSKVWREVPRDEATFLVISPEAPVGMEDHAGYRVSLLRRGSQGAIGGLPCVAYWSDYRRHAIPAGEPATAAAAINRRGTGRIAWVGFDPDLAATDPENLAAASGLLQSLLVWCGSIPVSGIGRWPGGKEAALLIEEDTEQDFENARVLDEILTAKGLRGSFLCVSDLARRHRDLVRSLAERHDVGSHSDDHTRLAGQSFGKQLRRLRRSASDLSKMTGRPVLGFRPPEEGYDDATLRALAQSGYGYILGNSESPRALPEILRFRSEKRDVEIVSVPRVQVDDYALLALQGLDDTGITEALASELEKTRTIGGVGLISLHTHLLGKPGRIGVVARFLDSTSLDRLWVTGADSLSIWWRLRSQVGVSVERQEAGRFALRVANGSAEPVPSFGVWLALPGNPSSLAVEEGEVVVQGPDGRGAFRILIEHLLPSETRVVALRVEGEMAARLSGRQ